MGIKVRRTGSADYGRVIKALIVGNPGAGKTLFSSTFPDVVYASAEGGMMSVHDRNVRSVEIKTSSQLLELKQQLDQPPSIREQFFGGPVNTVVVDTIDEVGRILQKERLAETKKEILAMADWGWFGEQMRGIIRSFRNLEMHVIFNCHVKTSEDGETGAMFNKPAIQGAAGDEIAGYVDLALLLQALPHTEIVDGETRRSVMRFLQTYPDSRHPWIKDRSGKLPMEFLVNFDDDFKRLEELIYGGMPPLEQESEAEQVETEQVEPEPVPVKAKAKPKAKAKAPDPQQESPEPEVQPTLEEQFAAEDAKVQVDEEPVPTQETVPEVGTPVLPAGPDPMQCVSCLGTVENDDQRELSNMRFRKTLCRKCFVKQKQKQS